MARCAATPTRKFSGWTRTTGSVISGWDNYLDATTSRVVRDTADADFRKAVGLPVKASPSRPVNGAAFSPKFSWTLSSARPSLGVRASGESES